MNVFDSFFLRIISVSSSVSSIIPIFIYPLIFLSLACHSTCFHLCRFSSFFATPADTAIPVQLDHSNTVRPALSTYQLSEESVTIDKMIPLIV